MMHSFSTVADRSRQPCPIVTYLPMAVDAGRPVGDVLKYQPSKSENKPHFKYSTGNLDTNISGPLTTVQV